MEHFGKIKANQQLGTLTIKTSNGTVKFGMEQPEDRTIDISQQTANQPQNDPQFTEEQQAALDSGVTSQRLATIEGGIQTARLDIQEAVEQVQELENRIAEVEQENAEPSDSGIESILGQIQNLQQQVQELRESKQNKLVSGQHIKTINNMDVLGSGNLEITGGESNNQQPTVTAQDIQDISTNVSQRMAQEKNERVDVDAALASRIEAVEGITGNLGSISTFNIRILPQSTYDSLAQKENNTIYFTVEG